MNSNTITLTHEEFEKLRRFVSKTKLEYLDRIETLAILLQISFGQADRVYNFITKHAFVSRNFYYRTDKISVISDTSGLVVFFS